MSGLALKLINPAPNGDISIFDLAPEEEDFLAAVWQGLARRPKQISPKFFYDENGREIYNEICKLQEYYPAAASIEILERYGSQIAQAIGPNASLIEYGSGDARKIRYLLESMQTPTCYVSIDIAATHLQVALEEVATEFAGLPLYGICGDYSRQLPVKKMLPQAFRKHLIVYFPGSSIGNFEPAEALTFLRRIRKQIGQSGKLLIGVDLKKEPAILHRAYNDSKGVTAQFNLNLLTRINRELKANFNVKRFAHYACYNPLHGRIEMHLVSRARQNVIVSGREFIFDEGESIHTENSYKYTLDEFAALAEKAAFQRETYWLDTARQFSLQIFQPIP